MILPNVYKTNNKRFYFILKHEKLLLFTYQLKPIKKCLVEKALSLTKAMQVRIETMVYCAEPGKG